MERKHHQQSSYIDTPSSNSLFDFNLNLKEDRNTRLQTELIVLPVFRIVSTSISYKLPTLIGCGYCGSLGYTVHSEPYTISIL